ncbi:MAG: S8 family serine peptidase [Candidatus Dormibacteria bacterium]
MNTSLAATRAGGWQGIQDGSGWTFHLRALAVGVAALATLSATATMSPRALASAATSSAPEQVIVRGAAGCGASVTAALDRLGGTAIRPLGILDGASAVIPKDEVGALLANPCVAAVTPDGQVTLSSFGGYDPTADVGSLYNTSAMIGAQTYWQNGFTGKGVGVALIDSGVTPVQGLGSSQLLNGPDLSFDSQSPSLVSLDGYGHGTHMAGIIAGNDSPLASGSAYAGNTSQYMGIAPDARVVNIKVADAHGATDVSQVIAGIDWAVAHAHDSGVNIRVINLSFGTNSLQGYQLDPLAFAAEQAWRMGIVVVVAAGNGGLNTTSLTDPAYDPYVLAVGAADTNGTTTTADDTVATFSSTGSATRSPDLVAPGVHIESLRDPGSYIDTLFGSTATVATRFFLGSGTSQATAVVSGAAALLVQQHPSWSPDQIKYVLTHTATPLAGQPSNRQGHGEINLRAALKADADSDASSQSYGWSSGLGTLDGSRGNVHLVANTNGAVLSGEVDVTGKGWSSALEASLESTGSAWTGGVFNGSALTGSGWSGSGWSGSGWSGSGWSGTNWQNAAWTGSGWSGSGWSGSGWSSNSWTGSGWSGSGWSGSGWSGSGWSGSGWSGSGWSGSGWSGSGWSGAAWS